MLTSADIYTHGLVKQDCLGPKTITTIYGVKDDPYPLSQSKPFLYAMLSSWTIDACVLGLVNLLVM